MKVKFFIIYFVTCLFVNSFTFAEEKSTDNFIERLLGTFYEAKVFEINKDINELLLEYSDLFTEFDFFTVGTVDGTLNYVFSLLVDLEEYESRNIQKK